ncbi:MAG: hypothetical protein HY673_12885 [Chloroflexi bacterium]|nr:hypothetical protein [Chloroflexota bacterium]
MNEATQSPGELYRERLKRVQDAIQLKAPDRVPLVPTHHFFPTNAAGMTARQAMFDYEGLEMAWKRFTVDIQPDLYNTPYRSIGLGPLFEAMDTKQYRWPGHGVAPQHSYQFVEGEYMKPEEYDAFLFDPSDYILRYHLPRIFGTLEPLKQFPRLSSLESSRTLTALSVLGSPEVVRMVQALAGAAAAEKIMRERSQRYARDMEGLGFPPSQSGRALAPFDHIGDYFRGTRGIMLDMYQRPDKLLQALEKVMAITLETVVSSVARSDLPVVFIPLHKGAEGFMSMEQFKRFYWPTLRRLTIALIDHGLIPFLFFEGHYDSRLEIIADIPPGKAIYKFEHTSLFRAKEVLGDRVCLRGNVPASLLCTGSPGEVRAFCKKLIDVAGKNGGYMMDGATGIPDEARPENVRAMVDFTRDYGVYR